MASGEPAAAYDSSAGALSDEVRARVVGSSWREECPVPLEGLAYVEVKHWGYDGKVHQGELIVDAELADDVRAIFRELFAARFPIEKMKLVDDYGASDDKSMAANNTSAFNCRWVTGKKGVFSKHSYGRAIDINPLTNPYVKGKRIEPPGGRAFLDRKQDAPGLIRDGDVVVRAFASRGWSWGGRWRSLKDYQHFEAPKSSTHPRAKKRQPKP